MIQDAIGDVDHWFLKRGLPHFIEDYRAQTVILTRAVPALVFVLLLEIVVNAPARDFALWIDLVAAAVALAVVIGLWALLNRVRGRPALAAPRRVGTIEVAFFVFGPAVVPVIAGGQWRSGIATAALNVVLLAAIYIATSYALVPTIRWGIGQTSRDLADITTLFARALPLVVLFVTFLFLTNEVWQITNSLAGPWYWIALGMFFAIGIAFTLIRVPGLISQLSTFSSWDEITGLAVGTPAEPLCRLDPPAEVSPPLRKRQWGNVTLVVLFSQSVQIVLVTLLVFGFLVVFGTIVATEPIVHGFLGAPPHVLAHIDLWDRQMVVTEQLIRIAGFLAVFSGFNFAVTVQTDAAYREEFLDSVLDEVRRSCAVRVVYRDALQVRSTMLSST